MLRASVRDRVRTRVGDRAKTRVGLGMGLGLGLGYGACLRNDGGARFIFIGFEGGRRS